jgi:hypothetical protein
MPRASGDDGASGLVELVLRWSAASLDTFGAALVVSLAFQTS